MIQTLLYIHIASGFTALLLGLVAMFAPKGQKLHNRSGLIYFWSMMVISLTSTLISLFGEQVNIFLLLVGIFSFYLTFTGYRSTKIKHKTPPLLDKIVTGLMLLTTIGMVAFALYSWSKGSTNLAIVLGIFGFIGGFFATIDVLRYKNGLHHPKEWMMEHLGRMCGAYIATFTAFAVTNLTAFLPSLLLWIVPAIGGGLCIVLTTKYYRKVYNIPTKKELKQLEHHNN